jgi:hypothetical protein
MTDSRRYGSFNPEEPGLRLRLVRLGLLLLLLRRAVHYPRLPTTVRAAVDRLVWGGHVPRLNGGAAAPLAAWIVKHLLMWALRPRESI